MRNTDLSRYLGLIEPLSIDMKLALISALAESIRSDLEKVKVDKGKLFEELKGSWADVDGNIEEEIYGSRS